MCFVTCFLLLLLASLEKGPSLFSLPCLSLASYETPTHTHTRQALPRSQEHNICMPGSAQDTCQHWLPPACPDFASLPSPTAHPWQQWQRCQTCWKSSSAPLSRVLTAWLLGVSVSSTLGNHPLGIMLNMTVNRSQSHSSWHHTGNHDH